MSPPISKSTVQKRRFKAGDIGAIHASINHPLLRFLKEDRTCARTYLSRRVDTLYTRLTNKNPDQLKIRPCLINKGEIYLMGTMEGQEELQIDVFTRQFLIPVYPTSSTTSGYQLEVTPGGMKTPSYIIGYPLSSADTSSKSVQGHWRGFTRNEETQRPQSTTFRVSAQELNRFKQECREKQFNFSAQNPEFKEVSIREFLGLAGKGFKHSTSNPPEGQSKLSVSQASTCLDNIYNTGS